GIGTRGAREGRLVDEDDFAEEPRAESGEPRAGGVGDGDRFDGGRVFGELVLLGEETLVDDVVEKRGFAGTGDAAEADEAVEREAEGKVPDVVFGDVGEVK